MFVHALQKHSTVWHMPEFHITLNQISLIDFMTLSASFDPSQSVVIQVTVTWSHCRKWTYCMFAECKTCAVVFMCKPFRFFSAKLEKPWSPCTWHTYHAKPTHAYFIYVDIFSTNTLWGGKFFPFIFHYHISKYQHCSYHFYRYCSAKTKIDFEIHYTFINIRVESQLHAKY